MKNKSRKKKGAVPKINPLKVLTSIPGLIKGVIGIIVIVLIVFVIKKGFFDSKEGEVTTISQSSIEKILDFLFEYLHFSCFLLFRIYSSIINIKL